MRAIFCLSALIGVALSGRAAAVDLTTIDRSIRKEPAYQSKAPQYCLLVFGPQAKVRVWVVLDGDTLYLDRNGNGDLTDPGERLAPRFALHRPENRPDAEVLRTFDQSRPGSSPNETDGRPILSCKPEVFWFHVFQLVPREDFPDQDQVKYWRENPFYVALSTRTGYMQSARVAFAARPQDAPILHFDGPLRLALDDKFGPQELRRGESSELYVRLITPGLNATVTTDHGDISETAHPVAEVELPSGRPGGEPIHLPVELTERC
jgi:hypothetical protein